MLLTRHFKCSTLLSSKYTGDTNISLKDNLHKTVISPNTYLPSLPKVIFSLAYLGILENVQYVLNELKETLSGLKRIEEDMT